MKAFFITLLLVAATILAATASAQGVPVLDDAAITAQVKKAISSDASLKSMDISVETQDGVVYLRGFVNTTDDIARAAALARAVKGVSSVRNSIRVADRPSRA